MSVIRSPIRSPIYSPLYDPLAGKWAADSGGDPPVEWSPAQLFASSEAGCWIDPSDDSTCWQDTGKTTPAGDGDPVRVIEDKSGNGHDFTAPSDAARPTRTQGGNGKWYLQFDGSNDRMTNSFGATFSQPNYVAAAFAIVGDTAASDYIYNGISGSARNGLAGDSFFPASNSMFIYAGSAEATFGGGIAPGSLTAHVASVTFDGASSTVRFDGTEYNADTSPGTESLTGLSLGANAGGTEFGNNRLYGLVCLDVPPSTESKGQLDTWLATKADVTL